jgi:transketolase
MTSADRCKAHRRRILDLSQRGPSHVAPAFSCLEIVDLIYYELKRPDDVFLLSKGHGCLAQYVVLESLGLIKADDPSLGGHPDRGGHIEASTGSLGHGLGMAVGMAYAEYLKGTDTRIFCVISDGELQEGSTWEAAHMAHTLKLDNLICFVDANGYGGLERIQSVEPMPQKFESFGWEAVRVNGHSHERLKYAVDRRIGDLPLAVLATTTKGQGASYMVDAPIWHYKSPSAVEYALAMKELA